MTNASRKKREGFWNSIQCEKNTVF